MKSDRIDGMPPVVHRAKVQDDLASLRYFGKKGAEAAKKNRLEKRDSNDYFDEKARDKETLRRMETNEHIAPINPEDQKEEV